MMFKRILRGAIPGSRCAPRLFMAVIDVVFYPRQSRQFAPNELARLAWMGLCESIPYIACRVFRTKPRPVYRVIVAFKYDAPLARRCFGVELPQALTWFQNSVVAVGSAVPRFGLGRFKC